MYLMLLDKLNNYMGIHIIMFEFKYSSSFNQFMDNINLFKNTRINQVCLLFIKG